MYVYAQIRKASRVNVPEPANRYLSHEEAKRFYDRLGSRQDWQCFYENPAINELISHAAFGLAQSVFEFGCGTGAFAARLLRHHLFGDASYVGLDISSKMISLALERLKLWSPRVRLYQSDGSRRIPEADHNFDRFVPTYVLDLLAPDFIEQLLAEARRLLVPGGKLCLVRLTFGVTSLSRAVCYAWQGLWNFSPAILGGCHPIELLGYLLSKTWNADHQSTLTSWGITSEVLVAWVR